MNSLKCYDVTCLDSSSNEMSFKVMTIDEASAMNCAENFFLDNKNLIVKAIKAREVKKFHT